MLARTISYTTLGLEALPVDVEVDAGRGLPALAIIGLPDQAVKEAKERVRSAILNSQYQLPSQRVTINLAPADIKKEGVSFTNPIPSTDPSSSCSSVPVFRKEGGYFTNLSSPTDLVQPRQSSGRKGDIQQELPITATAIRS